MSGAKSVSALVLLVAGGLITALETLAQACLGNPAGPGRFALVGSMGFPELARDYGVGLLPNLEGPLAVGASYTRRKLDILDENINTFDGIIALDLLVEGIVACPATGLGYSRFSTGFDANKLELTDLVIPFGLGLGNTFTGDGPFSLTLHAMPQFLHIRTTREARGGIEKETNTGIEFAAGLGFTLGLRRIPQVFFGGGVLLTTAEAADPIFSIELGLIFP